MLQMLRDHLALLSSAGSILAAWWGRRRILAEMRAGFADLRALLAPAAPIDDASAHAFPPRSPHYAPADSLKSAFLDGQLSWREYLDSFPVDPSAEAMKIRAQGQPSRGW